MKKILIKFGVAFICFLGITTSQSQVVYPLTGHPRLFFLSSDEASLKSKLSSNATLSKVHNVIIDECNKMLTLPYQQRVVTDGTMITISREAFRRIGFLCYAYRMTSDTRYAARAESEMLAMAAFPDWNPSNQLDFTEMTMAMAIGYDWLYNYLGQDSRLTIANAIKQKGIEETIGTKANKYFLQDKREIYSNVNSIQVGNASISAGVAAVYDEDPAYYQPLIDRAINLIKFPMGVYQYNGAYPESVMYWEYGTTFNIFMIDMLQRMWGTDRDLLKMEGFLKTSNFALQMHGTATKLMNGDNLAPNIPQVFNFGDGYSSFFIIPSMFWLASQAPELSNLSIEMKKLDFATSTATWSLQNNRFLPFLLIWSRNLSLNNLPLPTENTYIAQGLSAVASLRTGWNNNDIFLAIKGGTSSASHTHMDIGSFVMDALDVRWAMDFGGGSALNISNMGHNTLTINGNPQLKSGYATVGNLINTPAQKSVDIDMTTVYANDVVSCTRTGAIISNRFVEIKDVIKASATPLTVRWNLLTQAIPVKVSNKIILLSQSTKKLYLIFEGTDQVTAKTWSTQPDGTRYGSNTGTSFTGFEYSIPIGTTQTATVKLVPEGDPILNGLNLTAYGKSLNENFESFSLGSLSDDFVFWKMNPYGDFGMKAVLGEVITNPFKSGINTSEKVLKITRQDDSGIITPNNAGNYATRGANAYGYDLRVNPNSIVEFKYYKDVPGSVYLRIIDGNGNVLGRRYADPSESLADYSTAQWRTAQFAMGSLNLSNFRYSPSGYLMISLENDGTEALQEKELTMYVDDIKMLPPSTTAVESLAKKPDFKAFFDSKDERIYVLNLPESAKRIKLFDTIGRLLNDVQVYGDFAMLECNRSVSSVLIVQVIMADGSFQSVKVLH